MKEEELISCSTDKSLIVWKKTDDKVQKRVYIKICKFEDI